MNLGKTRGHFNPWLCLPAHMFPPARRNCLINHNIVRSDKKTSEIFVIGGEKKPLSQLSNCTFLTWLTDFPEV